ncbi:MAG: 1-deoxy-D-xylulose-5-phosphate synthase, partial [Kitasatospora sp.]|nr:1-deoxy-D-xylulose-5-phosphate synthase [Kitasatospora sp.]
MTLLESINGPRDLKQLSPEQLPQLAAEIRDVLIDVVSRTSGHLGPNLGVVELTIALHRVFDSPMDRIVFDTGHQAYVHKLLTGRQPGFGTLRQRGGVSGYPSQAESEHDIVENSHASTSLAYADGLAKAYRLRGETGRTVVAVIGDGALTGGMAWEALNNISVARDSKLVIVVNDNGRSYQPTIGGLADHLAAGRVAQRYENVLDDIKTTLPRAPIVGPPLYETLHGIKKGIKDVLQPQVLFEDLGLKYVGPIDGHNEEMVEHALRRAAGFGAPVLVHVITKKGYGYPPAEQDEKDCFHQVPGAAPPGRAAGAPKRTWSEVFGDELVAIGARRPDVIALTAAMLHPTGLGPFACAFPDRVLDVGIAEQQAMTCAAGLALGGLHPVVALYSTFLNRAFDQALMDVALHRLPVTIALDRAGVTGPDGASHNGMWDGSILQLMPGMRIAAPRDAIRLAELLNEAVAITDGPAAIRYPKGTVGGELEAVRRLGSMDVLHEPGDAAADVLLIGAGPMAVDCVQAGQRLADQGIGVTVLDPRWLKPLDEAL